MDWFRVIRLWKPCLPKKGDPHGLEVKMVADELAEIIADRQTYLLLSAKRCARKEDRGIRK